MEKRIGSQAQVHQSKYGRASYTITLAQLGNLSAREICTVIEKLREVTYYTEQGQTIDLASTAEYLWQRFLTEFGFSEDDFLTDEDATQNE